MMVRGLGSGLVDHQILIYRPETQRKGSYFFPDMARKRPRGKMIKGAKHRLLPASRGVLAVGIEVVVCGEEVEIALLAES